jgi:hypothetical protein
VGKRRPVKVNFADRSDLVAKDNTCEIYLKVQNLGNSFFHTTAMINLTIMARIILVVILISASWMTQAQRRQLNRAIDDINEGKFPRAIKD